MLGWGLLQTIAAKAQRFCCTSASPCDPLMIEPLVTFLCPTNHQKLTQHSTVPCRCPSSAKGQTYNCWPYLRFQCFAIWFYAPLQRMQRLAFGYMQLRCFPSLTVTAMPHDNLCYSPLDYSQRLPCRRHSQTGCS